MTIFRSKEEKLWVYSLRGNMKGVRKMIKSGADVNRGLKQYYEELPLHLAADRGNVELVKFLLDNGAKVDARCLRKRTPLHRASRVRNVAAAKLLVENGADVNAEDIHKADSLLFTMYRRNVEVARLLIQWGADVNHQDKEGHTALHEAASRNHYPSVKLLLENGADVTIVDFHRRTVLYELTDLGQEPTMKAFILLVEYGANMHALDDQGRPPLHKFILCEGNGNFYEIALYLLARGVSIRYESDVGQKYLCTAVAHESRALVCALLKQGADPLVSATDGKNAMEIAIDRPTAKNWMPLMESFSTFDKAMASENGAAVQGILRRSMINESVSDMITRYDEVKNAGDVLMNSEWKRTLTCVVHDHKVEILYFAFKTDDTDKRNAIFKWINDKNWIQSAAFSDGSTLMQRAVTCINFDAMERMILYEVNPYKDTNDNQWVWEAAESEFLRDKTRDKVMEIMKIQYAEYVHKLSRSQDMATLGYTKLLQSMLYFSTSLNDVSLIVNISVCNMQPEAIKLLSQRCLETVVRRRLVYEDHDPEHLIAILSEMRERNYILESQSNAYIVRAMKFNLENPTWAQRMKAAIQKIDGHLASTSNRIETLQSSFKGLVTALEENEKMEATKEKIWVTISLTCSSLVLFGGQTIKKILEPVVFMKDPGLILEAFTDSSQGVVEEPLIKDELKRVLEEAAIPPDEFVVKLQEVKTIFGDKDKDASITACINEVEKLSGNATNNSSRTVEKFEVMDE